MTDTSTLDYTGLRDVNSPRGKFATLVPSTNTTVEHDFHQVAPKGVTFPVGRMYIPAPTSKDDPEFANIITQVAESLEDAVKVVMTTRPDYLIMAMSAPCFWGGVAGNERFEQRIRDLSGLEVSGGATACRAALEALKAKSIAFLSPYQGIGDEHVQRYFEEAGFTVVRFKGLSGEELAAYLAGGEWHGKAGGYAIQGSAEGLIAWISGSHSGVVGLPLFETRTLLRSAGFPVG